MNTVKLSIGAILVAGLLAACSSATQTSTTDGVRAQATRTVAAVATRTIVTQTTVTVDGALVLGSPTLDLGFEQSGKVTSVNVTAGQMVNKGDVLARVDDTTLQQAVEDADLQLKQAEASIRLQNAPPTKEELAAAQAALNAAYASYNTTKAGTSQSDIERARASWESAWNGYLSSQINRDVHCGTAAGTSTVDCQQQEAAYGSAYESMLAAKDAYSEILKPVSQASLQQAYAGVTSAQAKLDALSNKVSDEQRKVAELQLEQARSALERAKSNLSQATLTSPCNCVVQVVSVAPGMNAPAVALTLVDLSRMQFKTSNLTERDVARIRTGAAASVRLRPYSEALPGKVSALLSKSSGTQSGLALYTVLIDLDPTTKTLLPGMTGQADIVVK